jgi:polygalacturonase
MFNPRWLALLPGYLFACLLIARGADDGKGPEKRYVISNFGAMADGTSVNTKAIQAVIDQCAAQGGGVVVVPKGVFVTGSIFLKPKVNLEVEEGGVLKGSQNEADYPWIDTRIAGLEMKWPAALVNADHVDGLRLTGTGTIDGSGLPWWQRYWAARAVEPNKLDPHFKVPRPRLIHIINCKNVMVRDLMLKDSAFWSLQLTYCDGVEVHGLRVRAPHEPVKSPSTDGIDIDSTRNVLIEGCDIICNDDGICLKAGRDADGLRVNRPTENVVIRNCHAGYSGGLVVIGSETSGGIRHVRVTDCTVDGGCFAVARFKTLMGRGGVVEDIVYDNIKADGVRSFVDFNMNALSKTWLPPEFRTPAPADKGTPIMRDITIENVTVKNAKQAGPIVGLAVSPLTNISLINDSVEAPAGFKIGHTRGLVFKNVTVNGAPVEVKADND